MSFNEFLGFGENGVSPLSGPGSQSGEDADGQNANDWIDAVLASPEEEVGSSQGGQQMPADEGFGMDVPFPDAVEDEPAGEPAGDFNDFMFDGAADDEAADEAVGDEPAGEPAGDFNDFMFDGAADDEAAGEAVGDGDAGDPAGNFNDFMFDAAGDEAAGEPDAGPPVVMANVPTVPPNISKGRNMVSGCPSIFRIKKTSVLVMEPVWSNNLNYPPLCGGRFPLLLPLTLRFTDDYIGRRSARCSLKREQKTDVMWRIDYINSEKAEMLVTLVSPNEPFRKITGNNVMDGDVNCQGKSMGESATLKTHTTSPPSPAPAAYTVDPTTKIAAFSMISGTNLVSAFKQGNSVARQPNLRDFFVAEVEDQPQVNPVQQGNNPDPNKIVTTSTPAGEEILFYGDTAQPFDAIKDMFYFINRYRSFAEAKSQVNQGNLCMMRKSNGGSARGPNSNKEYLCDLPNSGGAVNVVAHF